MRKLPRITITVAAYQTINNVQDETSAVVRCGAYSPFREKMEYLKQTTVTIPSGKRTQTVAARQGSLTEGLRL